MPKDDAQAEIGTWLPSGLSRVLAPWQSATGVESIIRRGNIFDWRPRIPALHATTSLCSPPAVANCGKAPIQWKGQGHVACTKAQYHLGWPIKFGVPKLS